jgi:archaellum biogenesis ATPase FlaH|tara:strand:+ start:959 stop:2395 length:1437 start_codon:yes stop_codon:yes gene_type:complete
MAKNYDYEVQKVYLEMMLADAETFVRCQGIFDSTLFDRKLQEAAEFMNMYTKQYNVLPDYEMVNASCRTDLKHPGDVKEGHTNWLMDEFESFTRHKSLERAILKSADLLEQHEYGEVEGLVKEAVQIGLARDMGTDYFLDPKARLMGLKDKNGQVTTGWDSLDRKLFGGFNRGELNIFAGGSGAGKSLFLANLGVNFALEGLNVVYLTLELSEALVSMRVDSMVTGISTRNIFKDLDDVEMKVKMIGKKAGMMQIKYMPSGKTANDIRAYLKEYEIKAGKKVDVLLVDYLDLLMPIGKKISAENLFVKDKYVSEELRNLAMELQTVFVTAAQLNRGAVEEVEFDHSHISGGLSKIQTADNVFGIFTSRAMRERGRYQIQLMKTRSSSGVGQKVDLGFDIDTLRIVDIDEDEQESTNGERTGNSSILDSIKRKTATSTGENNTPTDDPTDGASVGKIRGKVESTKLREILSNMGSDEEY